MVKDLEEVQRILKKYNQEHLLYFFDRLDENEKNILIRQIKHTNFKRMNKLYIGSFKDDSIEGYVGLYILLEFIRIIPTKFGIIKKKTRKVIR